MAKKDLFDDSVMSFGEHLEALRSHLIKALIGLTLAILVALYYSRGVMLEIQRPVTEALRKYYSPEEEKTPTLLDKITQYLPWPTSTKTTDTPKPPPDTITIDVDLVALAQALHELNPAYPAPAADAPAKTFPLAIPREKLPGGKPQTTPTATTLTPEEAFMVYMKVAVITGLVFASPWVFYQLWLFVAAGLYPHERRYVYIYLPMSLGLFFAGVFLCFYGVIPFVLDFLFGFNKWLNLKPEIRITEWVSFAALLPIMFGVSFQLPLVMLFLEKINVFRAQDYREKRRISILVIAVVSMVLTPSDPVSMLLMMCPLIVLYEFGILLCGSGQPQSPFEGAATT